MKTAGFTVRYGLDGKPAAAETHDEWLAGLLGRDGSFMLPRSLSHVPAMKKHALAAFLDELEKLAAVSTPLLPHQQRAVDRLQREDQPGLVAIHGLGSGKTLTSIAAQEAAMQLKAASSLGMVKNLAGVGGLYGGVVGASSGARKKKNPDSARFSERHPAVSGGLRGAAIGTAVGGAIGGKLESKAHPGRITREVGRIVQRAGDRGTLLKGDIAAHLPNKKRDEMVDEFLSHYKKAGVLGNIAGAVKGALTKPIAGTPELSELAGKAGKLLHGGASAATTMGKGPSKGFQAFQARQSAAMH